MPIEMLRIRQSAKAARPIVATDAGMTIDFSDEHRWKAFLPIRVSFDPGSNAKLARLSQSEKQ
jgi:hypothetical protein